MRGGIKIAGPLLLGVAAGLVAGMATGATRRMEFDMTWRYGPPAEEWPASKHIILTFVEFPDHYVGIYSPDLGDYLESLPSDRVRVVFDVSPVFGGMHGADWVNPVKLFDLAAARVRGKVWYNAVRIGELTRWRSESGYGGSRGNPLSSPWD